MHVVSAYCSFAYSALACFRIGNVGIGVFPEGEETFVGGEGPDAGGVGIGSLFTPRPTRFKRF